MLREYEPIDNTMETQRAGTKNSLLRTQWLLYSPCAILSSEAANNVFPDVRAIWVYCALAQCIPSLSSLLCLHTALYTGRRPTDSRAASMGEKVLGIFGSGTANAVDYYGGCDQRRMAHCANRDVKRHTFRIAQKTLDYFSVDLDRFRRMQIIDGQTECFEGFRPLHDSQMPYFCLNVGIIGKVFDDYIFQLEEFAFEKRLGATIREYKPLTPTGDQAAMGILETREGVSTGMGLGPPMAGHYLQEHKGWK